MNVNDTEKTVSLPLDSDGNSENMIVRDLRKKTSLAKTGKTVQVSIPAHGAALYSYLK